MAAALFSVAEVTSFYIFADHGEAYDLRKIALTDSFLLQSLLTLFAGALLLGGWSVSTSGKPKQPGDWG